MIPTLNLDVHEEILAHLNNIDTFSLLLTSRSLYFTDSLWHTFLSYARERGPIGCSPTMILDSLTGYVLRRIGHRTAGVSKAWSQPHAPIRSMKSISLLSGYDKILAIVPGAGIILTIAPGEPVIVRCIDVLREREIAFIYIDDMHQWSGMIITTPPRNEPLGHYTIGFNTDAHVIALRVDFSDREEVTFRQILKTPIFIRNPEIKFANFPTTCVVGTSLYLMGLCRVQRIPHLLYCILDLSQNQSRAAFHAIEIDHPEFVNEFIESCFVAHDKLVLNMIVDGMLDHDDGTMHLACLSIPLRTNPPSRITPLFYPDPARRGVDCPNLYAFSRSGATGPRLILTGGQNITRATVNFTALGRPEILSDNSDTHDIAVDGRNVRHFLLGNSDQHALLVRRGAWGTQHYRFTFDMLSWPADAYGRDPAAPQLCRLDFPADLVDTEQLSTQGGVKTRCAIDDHLGVLYILRPDGLLYSVAYA